MEFKGPVHNTDLYKEQVRYGKEEQARRKESPVFVSGDDVERLLKTGKGVYLVDNRMGFNNRTHRLFVSKHLPREEEEKRTLGHRHTVEAVIHWLRGKGYSVVDGKRYDWEAGDFICVPMFAWHLHVVLSEEPALHIASTTGPLSMGIGTAVYEDDRFPEYWVYAQQGEDALKTLIPAGAEENAAAPAGSGPAPKNGSTSGRLYAEEVAFASEEEIRRRESKVLVRGRDLRLEPTAMGHVAYVVDPRIGFHAKTLGTLVAEVPPGKRSGAHRHFYDEIDYVLAGHGRAIVADKTYEIKKGDALAIPTFAWHQYFNDGDEPLRFLVHNTRPLMQNLGFSLTHQGEVCNF
jgi:quercetin dioxygenase-like cupin family protein